MVSGLLETSLRLHRERISATKLKRPVRVFSQGFAVECVSASASVGTASKVLTQGSGRLSLRVLVPTGFP